MSEISDIRALAQEAEPTIKKWLEIGEIIAGFRDTATEKKLEWSQLKAALVAKIKDDADGGDRLEKLTAKADKALTYADALRTAENKLNSEKPQKPPLVSAPPKTVTVNIIDKYSTEAHAASISSPVNNFTPSPIPEQTEPVADGSPSDDGEDAHFETSALGQRELSGDNSFGASSPIPDDEFNGIPNFLNRAPVDLVSV